MAASKRGKRVSFSFVGITRYEIRRKPCWEEKKIPEGKGGEYDQNPLEACMKWSRMNLKLCTYLNKELVRMSVIFGDVLTAPDFWTWKRIKCSVRVEWMG